MTKEDKQLLLADLCARLPYGVKIHRVLYGATTLNERNIESFRKGFDDMLTPYLRPMSSMTEEEKGEIYNWLVENDIDWFDFSKLRLDEILISFDSSWLLVDWLNAHHFDFRNLIERGLAIDCTGLNVY